MTDPARGTSSASSNGTSPDAIAAEVAVQRERVAADVAALRSRMDVRARTKEKVQATLAGLRSRATTPTGAPQPALLAAAGVLVLAVVTVRRRRAR